MRFEPPLVTAEVDTPSLANHAVPNPGWVHLARH